MNMSVAVKPREPYDVRGKELQGCIVTVDQAFGLILELPPEAAISDRTWVALADGVAALYRAKRLLALDLTERRRE
jgi:hypothetical protein